MEDCQICSVIKNEVWNSGVNETVCGGLWRAVMSVYVERMKCGVVEEMKQYVESCHVCLKRRNEVCRALVCIVKKKSRKEV